MSVFSLFMWQNIVKSVVLDLSQDATSVLSVGSRGLDASCCQACYDAVELLVSGFLQSL